MASTIRKNSFVRACIGLFSRTTVLHVLLVAFAYSALPTQALIASQAIGEQVQSREVVIPKGTKFTIVTSDDMFSSTVLEGDAVYFKVADDVVVDGALVIAKGTTVEGTVIEATLGRRYGLTGVLALEVGSTTTVDGQTIRLNGSYSKNGRANPAAVGTLFALLGACGPGLYHGKSAHIPAGTRIEVSTTSEKRVRVKLSAP